MAKKSTKKTYEKWWQAARTAIAIAVTALALFVYTNKVAEVNWKIGAQAGFNSGQQQCPRTLYESALWLRTPES